MNRRFFALLALAATACTTEPGDRVFRGIYTFGFEVVAFAPCREHEAWWVTFPTPEAAAQFQGAIDSLVTTPTNFVVYIEAQGTPSAPGHYGAFGEYPREFAVTRVVRAAATPPPSCANLET